MLTTVRPDTNEEDTFFSRCFFNIWEALFPGIGSSDSSSFTLACNWNAIQHNCSTWNGFMGCSSAHEAFSSAENWEISLPLNKQTNVTKCNKNKCNFSCPQTFLFLFFYLNRLVELDKLKQLSRKQERKETVSRNLNLYHNFGKRQNSQLSSVVPGGRSGRSGDNAKQQQRRNHGEVYQGFQRTVKLFKLKYLKYIKVFRHFNI